MNNRRKKRLGIVLGCCLAAILCLSGAVIGIVNFVRPSHAAKSDDTTSYVSVGEICNNSTNLQKLYNILGGASGTTYSTLKNRARGYEPYDSKATAAGIHSWSGGIDADDIRKKTYGKNAGQDVQVTFGGQKWDVCFLSNSRSGDLIMTLMLTTPLSTKIQYGHYCENNTKNLYPSSIYGTSYIRAWLNNGGEYAMSRDQLTTYSGTPNYELKEFCGDGQYTSYLVTPSKVQWQEYATGYGTHAGSWRHSPNDAYGTPIVDIPKKEKTYLFYSRASYKDGYKGGWWDVGGTWNDANYAALQYKASYGDWQNDYLWLPSITEVQFSHAKSCTGISAWDNWNTQNGMWYLSDAQRSAGSDSYYWLRSGDYNNAGNARLLRYDGYGSYANVNVPYYVRPCIHLNLAVFSDNQVNDGMIIERTYDGEDQKFENWKPGWYRDFMQTTYRLNGAEVTDVVTPGEYAVSIQAGDKNYSVTLVIKKAPITISANPASSAVGATLSNLSAVVIGGKLAKGDSLGTVVRLYTTADASVEGKYLISATVINDYYDVTMIDGIYTVGSANAPIKDAYDNKIPEGWTGFDKNGNSVTIR